MAYFWLFIFIALLVLEASTTQFICIWFAGGALAALITALCHLQIWLQCIVFVAVSAILLIFTKPLIHRLKSKPTFKTNTDALIGQSAVVLEDISNIASTGAVRLRGVIWSARSINDKEIIQGTIVTVKKIDGVKLIVDIKKEEV